MDVLSAIRKAIAIERDALEALIERTGAEAVEAVELLFSCKGQVIVTGIGKAGLIARKIAATFSSTGTPACFLHPTEAIHGDLGIVSSRDVAMALSNSGETEELVVLLPHLKRIGVKIISLTSGADSTLGKYSDIVIDTGVTEEAEPLGVAPTASTTTQLAMGDALAAAVAERRGFSPDQFAIFHPGGSLGRKLLWLVEDLMHSGDAAPVVDRKASLHDAILNMTSKRLGATFVTGDDGTLVGIITDGDLRRIFQKYEQKTESLFDMAVEEVMVRDPKTVHGEMLAAEAMRLMEDHSISVLPVVNGEGKPAGAIHLHDLVRAGLA